jgi:alpha-L-rhamnosidase
VVPDELRGAVAVRLAELVRAAGTRLTTGFLATPDLLPVLADTGHLDLAYDLLLQDAELSWLAMIERGATTMWEHWNGVDAAGVANGSLNHHSKGAVVSFLHRYVAGLEPLAPGYRRFRVRPRPGGALTWAEAAHESPYGRIEASWRLGDERLHIRVVVPPGTEAEIVLPDGSGRTAGPGVTKVDAPLLTLLSRGRSVGPPR